MFRSETRWFGACSHSDCSPIRPPARRSRHPRRRCRRSSAGSATGTTDSRGLETRASASAPSSVSARSTKHACSSRGSCTPADSTGRDCPSCSPCTASTRALNALDNWPGYANSTPVRVGNGAADQHQLDGYGWVLDAAWLLTRAGQPLNSEAWRAMRGFADRVCERWREPDAGIWEVRGDAQHHVHSKLMAWLALDRALRIADTRRVSKRRHRRWRTERDAIAEDVRNRGFDESAQQLQRSYDSDELDAAVLVLPLLGIEEPDSPRVRDTIDAIQRSRRGRPAAVPLPPGPRRASRQGRRIPSVLVLARPSTREDRARRRSHCTVQLAGAARDPARALRRGDGPHQPRASGQLPPGAHPRRSRPGRARIAGCPSDRDRRQIRAVRSTIRSSKRYTSKH